ncbi:MAG: hypothetical protein QOE12_438, partial [Mycobacterium sp.]|nr:hypothetical protein [Mycobacterium sp.]
VVSNSLRLKRFDDNPGQDASQARSTGSC